MDLGEIVAIVFAVTFGPLAVLVLIAWVYAGICYGRHEKSVEAYYRCEKERIARELDLAKLKYENTLRKQRTFDPDRYLEGGDE